MEYCSVAVLIPTDFCGELLGAMVVGNSREQEEQDVGNSCHHTPIHNHEKYAKIFLVLFIMEK